jgi:hypothetical protein
MSSLSCVSFSPFSSFFLPPFPPCSLVPGVFGVLFASLLSPPSPFATSRGVYIYYYMGFGSLVPTKGTDRHIFKEVFADALRAVYDLCPWRSTSLTRDSRSLVALG